MKYITLPGIRPLKFTFFSLTTLIFALAISTATAQAWIVIDWQGKVSYIPADRDLNKKNAVSIYKHQRLKQREVIVIEANSEVTLKCSREDSGTVVRSGRRDKIEPVTNICGLRDPFLGDPTEIRLGGNNPLIPYIVSPRYTLLLENRPTLRWNAVEGAIRYTVKLYREELLEDIPVWQRSVESTEPIEGVEEFSYPSEEKPLEAGADYRLLVEADNDRRSQEEKIDIDEYDIESRGVSELRFRLLGEVQAQSVREAIEEITQRQSPSDDDLITLALHYAENNLYAEAIEILNSVVKNDSKKPELYRILGDFYAQSGLNLLAEESYLKAIEKAKETQEVLEEALAHQDLGELYMKMHEPSDDVSLLEQARAQFEEALAQYRKLNRQPKIDEIINLISQL
jgi:tetratricopeptide (TPR) repeat protein